MWRGLVALLLTACWRGGVAPSAEPESAPLAMRATKLAGLVRVPAGAITMGCLEHRGARCLGRQMPAFEILAGYVTRADWARCVADGACPRMRDAVGDRPMTDVTFGEARKLCRWAGLHLTTESAETAGVTNRHR